MGGVDRVESLGSAEDCQFSFWRRRLDMPANDGLLHCFSFQQLCLVWHLDRIMRCFPGAFFGVHKIPCVTLLKYLALTSTKHHAFLLV